LIAVSDINQMGIVLCALVVQTQKLFEQNGDFLAVGSAE